MRNILIAGIALFCASCSSNKYLVKENTGNFEQLRAGENISSFMEMN